MKQMNHMTCIILMKYIAWMKTHERKWISWMTLTIFMKLTTWIIIISHGWNLPNDEIIFMDEKDHWMYMVVCWFEASIFTFPLAKVYRTYLNNKKTSLKNITKLKSKSKSGGIIFYFTKFGDFFNRKNEYYSRIFHLNFFKSHFEKKSV